LNLLKLYAASIPCKRYTFNPAPRGGRTCDTLQVFSVKVTELTRGLQWPINVFGMVALHDSLDHNRNIIFKCERDNCQTLTDEVCSISYLHHSLCYCMLPYSYILLRAPCFLVIDTMEACIEFPCQMILVLLSIYYLLPLISFSNEYL
jgi:hypothetical protein